MADFDEWRYSSDLVTEGHDLFYQSGDQIMAASYPVTGDMFVPGKPRVWIPTRVSPGRPNSRAWDLAPDGKRITLLTPVDSADAGKQGTRWCSSRTSSTSCGGACR